MSWPQRTKRDGGGFIATADHSTPPCCSSPLLLASTPRLSVYFQCSQPSSRKKQARIMGTVSLVGICLKKNYKCSGRNRFQSPENTKKGEQTPPNTFEFQVIRTITLISFCVAVSYGPHCSHTLILQHTGLWCPPVPPPGLPFPQQSAQHLQLI